MENPSDTMEELIQEIKKVQVRHEQVMKSLLNTLAAEFSAEFFLKFPEVKSIELEKRAKPIFIGV